MDESSMDDYPYTVDLNEVSRELIGPGMPIPAVERLKSLILEYAPFSPLQAGNIAEGETRLSSGLAVSPSMAAMCLNEHCRTHRFIAGLNQAVEALLKDNPKRQVSVLYAGCGPWATLALPLMSLYPASTLRFTLLDIHPESIASAQQLIAKLVLDDRVGDYVVADASEYQVPKDSLPDIILSETMNVTLRNEPQVAISRNLVGQAPQAILIPEQVLIDLVQLAPGKEHSMVSSDHEGEIPPPQRERIHLGEVFTLDKENIAQWQGSDDNSLPAHSIELPAFLDPRLQLNLLTTITTYGDITLGDYDSSLTLPTKLQLGESVVPGHPVHFHYRLGDHPGLVAQQDVVAADRPNVEGLDRIKLPLEFDSERLLKDLAQFTESEWIDHFVKQNYEGVWQAIPLRAKAGACHPIQQIYSDPSCTDFCATDYLQRTPYMKEVLEQFQCQLLSVRLMKLNAGSRIKEHIDPDLAMESGYARLHIPITTNSQMEFLLNGEPVVMNSGECWYLRLSDPHSLNNNGDSDRVHIVIDAIANHWLSACVAESEIDSHHHNFTAENKQLKHAYVIA